MWLSLAQFWRAFEISGGGLNTPQTSPPLGTSLVSTIYKCQMPVVVSCKQYVDMCNMWILKRIMEHVYKLYTNRYTLVLIHIN